MDEPTIPVAQRNVALIAATRFTGQVPGVDWSTDAEGGQALAEFAGRACYQSWDKPNPATATNAGYLANILKVGHFSVLEHGTATFYLTGVPRSLTHEFIRHRHFSYSQLSQRYVPGLGAIVVPDIIANEPYLARRMGELAAAADEAYRDLLHGLERILQPPPIELWAACSDLQCPLDHKHDGENRRHQLPANHPSVMQASKKATAHKLARQAARAVLPNATETRIVVTGNYRAWRHFIDLRATEHADIDIRATAIDILRLLQQEAPNVFGDYTISLHDDGTEIASSPYAEKS